MGAVNISDFPPSNSALAVTVKVTSLRFTRVDGMSGPVLTTEPVL